MESTVNDSSLLSFFTNSTVEVNAATASTVNSASDCITTGLEYRPVPSVISAIAAACGMVLLLFGYRLHRVSFLVGGFVLGISLSYTIIAESAGGAALTALGTEATAGVVLATGALLGLCATLLPAAGLVIVGAECGTLLAAASLVVASELGAVVVSFPVSISICTVAAAVGGAATGASLLRDRPRTLSSMFGTSVLGAALVIVCLDYYVELHALLSATFTVLTAQALAGVVSSALTEEALMQKQLCLCTWLILASWPVLSVAGIMIQWQATGRGVNHSMGLHKRKIRKHADIAKLHGQIGQTDEWERYRSIYTARRSAGDVVSAACSKSVKKFSGIKGTRLHNETDEDTMSWTAAKKTAVGEGHT